MLRRKLFIYTIMYAAGVTAGFFVFERSRVIEAAGFAAAIIAAVIFTDTDGNTSNTNIKSQPCGRHTGPLRPMPEAAKQKAILMAFLVCGFIAFNIRAAACDSSAYLISQQDHISGKVTSVQIKGDSVKLTLKTEGKRPCRVLVSMDAPADDTYDEATEGSTGIYELAGAVIEARGEYKELRSADDPGCFDYRIYMRSKGVSAGFKAYVIEIIDPGDSLVNKAKRYLYRTRESFINEFSEETQGFIRGVIFGDKTEIDEDVVKEFNSNSTGHILAVSGLHMGFLYGLLRALTGRKRSLPISLSIIAVILLYGEMTLWSPATVRACIVMTVSLLSIHLRRRSDLLTSVSLAALIILAAQPYQLFNSGFQMSFLALLGIVFLAKPVSMVTGEALGVMLAVQAGTLPITAYTFGRFDPLSILINVPVILLASVLVPLCILLLMIETLFGSVLRPGIYIAELISYAVVKINHILNFGGEFSFAAAGAGSVALITFYILIFASSSEWVRIRMLRKDPKRLLKQGVLLLMPVFMLSSCFYDSFSDDEIVFVAVGQGDCTHIRAEGHDMLIDGGGVTDYGDKDDTKSSSYNVGEKILMPYLLHEGCDQVDIALVTHLHTDHYKGIAELAEVYPVGAIGIPIDYRGSVNVGSLLDENSKDPAESDPGVGSYDDPDEPESGDNYDDPDESQNNAIYDDSNETKSNTNSANPRILYIKPDTIINLTDDVSVEVLWPVEVSEDPIAADDPNEHNTVYMINYKGTKIMVTGDLLEEDELEMVRYYEGTDKLKCDILKVAHHGSKSSSSEEFLDAASPSLAVIQCGRNNLYHHPHQQTLDRLEERGITVLRTDINGAVGIDIRRRDIRVDIMHKE